MPFTIDRARLAQLSGEDRREAEEALKILDEVQRTNPLAFFEPHAKQLPFFEASTPIIAAFAGNRFGKTTALTVRALLECLDEDWLPQSIRRFKRWNKDNAPRGTQGRIVNPSFALLESVILPAFRQWTPAGALKGGSFDKAWKGPPDRKLQFDNGSFIQFMTHEQDDDKFGGAALHFVGYDEPPPRTIRDECNMRLADWNGYEMFACTPLKVNVAWMRRDIYKKREDADITVISGSIHDNPNVSEEGKLKALNSGDPRLRQAREFGHFVNVGGLIYPNFEDAVVDPIPPAFVAPNDVVIAIDPGVRNAAFIWGCFDSQDVGWIFDELLLQDKTVIDYVLGILRVNARWGLGAMSDREDLLNAIRNHQEEGIELADLADVQRQLEQIPEVPGTNRPDYVIDPAARSRSATNAQTVQAMLAAFGVGALPGDNAVEAGIMQVQQRLTWGRLRVSKDCRGLRDEADDYAAEDRDDGVLKPIKANDHRVDALRYLCQTRPWLPEIEEQAPDRQLGWVPGQAPKASMLRRPRGGHPMGSLA